MPFLRLIAAALLPALLLAGCDAADSAETAAPAKVPAALTVSVAPLVPQAMSTSVAATGTVVAWQEPTVSAETSGLAITEVLVAEGDHVEAGQVLARLDDALLAAEIAGQQAAVEEAQATLDNAEAAAARGDRLAAGNLISTESAEERTTATLTARAKLAQAEAALDQLEVQRDRTRITAPVAGTISEAPALVGTIVQAGTELFRIVRDGRLEVDALVPEQHLAAIAAGQAVTVTDAVGRTIEASVRGVAEKVDAGTRLGTVHVALPEGAGLKAGMFARVSIAVADEVLPTVAESALVWRDGQAGLFVVGDDGTVALHPVATGARRDGRVAIADGVAGDARVVVAGAGFLNDGDHVEVALADAEVATR